MAGYYSSLFGQLTFKFFQTRMADFTLFVGIKKNSFLKLSRMADFTLFVGIKKNSFYNIFGMAVALLRGYENFSLRYNFFKPGWPTSLCSSASRGYENKTATHRALRALVFLIMLLRYESKLSTS